MKLEFARSLSGHDKNQFYLILEEEERAAYLVNGRTHTLEKPKKKNKKHYQIIKHIPEDILVQFNTNGSLTDDIIYGMIQIYERSINK